MEALKALPAPPPYSAAAAGDNAATTSCRFTSCCGRHNNRVCVRGTHTHSTKLGQSVKGSPPTSPPHRIGHYKRCHRSRHCKSDILSAVERLGGGATMGGWVSPQSTHSTPHLWEVIRQQLQQCCRCSGRDSIWQSSPPRVLWDTCITTDISLCRGGVSDSSSNTRSSSSSPLHTA